jgi:hypothetical protein
MLETIFYFHFIEPILSKETKYETCYYAQDCLFVIQCFCVKSIKKETFLLTWLENNAEIAHFMINTDLHSEGHQQVASVVFIASGYFPAGICHLLLKQIAVSDSHQMRNIITNFMLFGK